MPQTKVAMISSIAKNQGLENKLAVCKLHIKWSQWMAGATIQSLELALNMHRFWCCKTPPFSARCCSSYWGWGRDPYTSAYPSTFRSYDKHAVALDQDIPSLNLHSAMDSLDDQRQADPLLPAGLQFVDNATLQGVVKVTR